MILSFNSPKENFGKKLGKGENVDKHHFVLFPQCFLFTFQSISKFNPFQIFYSSKLKEFSVNNLKFDENDVKFFEKVEKTVVKGEIACYQQNYFFHCVFKRLVLQKSNINGLFGKGLTQ